MSRNYTWLRLKCDKYGQLKGFEKEYKNESAKALLSKYPDIWEKVPDPKQIIIVPGESRTHTWMKILVDKYGHKAGDEVKVLNSFVRDKMKSGEWEITGRELPPKKYNRLIQRGVIKKNGS